MPIGPAAPDRKRLWLQVAVALGGCVPVGAGLAGVLLGARLAGAPAGPPLDSHVRYLSGLLLAIGLAFWASIPRIEHHRARFRLLTLVVVCGGLARLYGLITQGWPGWPMLFGLVMELAVTPALCVWQHRLRLSE